ncbi:hypothetical protein M5K25_008159 [Dendrobium thyrsiflorum]|uniref:Uncharacterized protein n=1 Tax=Dendrobium thyrsiflorum TaxID=117978 RepID=A0ABD0V7Q0_DENTH
MSSISKYKPSLCWGLAMGPYQISCIHLGQHRYRNHQETQKFYHLALRADGAGSDDRPNQDPIVPSSRLAQPDRRIFVSSHGLLRPRIPYKPGVMPLNSNSIFFSRGPTDVREQSAGAGDVEVGSPGWSESQKLGLGGFGQDLQLSWDRLLLGSGLVRGEGDLLSEEPCLKKETGLELVNRNLMNNINLFFYYWNPNIEHTLNNKK